MMKFQIKTLTMISGIFATSAAAMPKGPESIAADASAFDAAVARWKIANNETESNLDRRGSQYSVFVCENTSVSLLGSNLELGLMRFTGTGMNHANLLKWDLDSGIRYSTRHTTQWAHLGQATVSISTLT